MVPLENSTSHLADALGSGHFEKSKRERMHEAQSNSARGLINSKCCTTCSLLTRVVTQGLSGANERII